MSLESRKITYFYKRYLGLKERSNERAVGYLSYLPQEIATEVKKLIDNPKLAEEALHELEGGQSSSNLRS